MTPTPAPAASDELVELRKLALAQHHLADRRRIELAAARIEAYAAEMERKDARVAELERDNRDLQKIADELGCAVQAHADEEARATAAEAEAGRLRGLLDVALDALDNYADPTGYTDNNGDQYEADETQHPGIFARETAASLRAALRPAKGGREDV